MDFLNKEELGFVVNLAFELTSHGKVKQGLQAFYALKNVYKDNQVIDAGIAFSYMVVNEFDKADAIFDELCAKEDVFDEVLSLAALSKVLQDDFEKAQAIFSKIKDPNCSATSLYQEALEAKANK